MGFWVRYFDQNGLDGESCIGPYVGNLKKLGTPPI